MRHLDQDDREVPHWLRLDQPYPDYAIETSAEAERTRRRRARQARRAPRRRRAKRILLISALVLTLLVGSGIIGVGLYFHSVESGIDRVDAFGDVPEESRPSKAVQDAMNLLILGSDLAAALVAFFVGRTVDQAVPDRACSGDAGEVGLLPHDHE